MSAIYSLKYQARSVASIYEPESNEKHSFFIGTCSVKEKNEIHLIEYLEEKNVIQCKSVFSHPHEILSLTTSPTVPKVLFSSYHDGASHRASLWKLKDNDASLAGSSSDTPKKVNNSISTLEELLELKGHNGLVKIIWNAEDKSSDVVVTLDCEKIRLWNLEQGATKMKSDSCAAESKTSLPNLSAGCWDPHHVGNRFVTVNGRSIRVWDLNSMTEGQVVMHAHGSNIRDVDFNPNKPYHITTAGDDRMVRIWDLRKTKDALVTMSGHTHAVANVKYNKFHDQLILSAGLDNVVNLWSCVSVSSAPLGELEDRSNMKEGDKVIRVYNDHEDSVHAISWSGSHAWCFASLSYDGRVAINQVPQSEKYKILL
jgi:WD40 repeat protein